MKLPSVTGRPISGQGRGLTRRGALGLGLAAGMTSLTSCLGTGAGEGTVFDQPDGDIPAKFKDRTRVVLWSAFTAHNGEVFQKIIDDFHESQDEIFCEIQTFDGYDSVESKLAASLQAKQVPDIVTFSDVVWNRFFLAETLEPLSGYFDDDFGKDQFHEKFVEEGTVRGDLWWLPYARSTPLFYYNKEVFSEVGLPDRAPKTYAEYREWAEELQGYEKGGSKVWTRSYNGGDDWYFSGAAWAFGGGYSDGLRTKFLSDETIAALEFDQDFIDNGFGRLSSEPQGDFISGVSATYMDSTGALTGIDEAAAFDYGCGFLPEQEATGVPTGGAGLSMMRYSSQDRKDAAWEVIKYLSTGGATVDWTLGTGYLPSTKDARESPKTAQRNKENLNYQVAIEQLEIAQGPDMVRRYVPECVAEANTMIQAVYSGASDARSALKTVNQNLEPAIDRIEPRYKEQVEGK